MAKQKIYELAKELNKSSKDVMDFLNKNGMEVKSHMSSIDDTQIDMVKKEFAPKTEAPEEAPKKKKIVALYNAQNSRGGVKPNPQKKETEKKARPQQDGERRPRPDGERRPFNRDGQQNGERRPFNKDGQQNGERRPFNRDGQQGDRRNFNKDFNKDFGGKDKDSDSRDNRQGGGRRDNGRRGGMDIPAPEKPLEKNRDNNRHNQN